MSAVTLVVIGIGLGWGVASLLFRREREINRARIEHLHDVLADRLPPGTYKPIRFRKGRSVIVGLGLLILGLVFAVVGTVVLLWNIRSDPTTTAVVTPALPIADPQPSSNTVQWNKIFGTTRAVDLVFALFLDGRGPDSKSIKLKDAFLESGITGEVIKMKVGSSNLLDHPFPISEASLIPPNGFIRLVATMNPLAPNQGLPNKEFLERWRKVWFNAIYENEKPDRILFDEKVMESYFPEIAGPHVTRTTP